MIEQQTTTPKDNWDYQAVNDLLGLGDVSIEQEEETFSTTNNILEDELEEDETNEEEQPQKKGFARNPWLKMALIGAMIGSGAIFIAALFSFAPTTRNTVAEVETEESEEIIEEIGNEGRVMASQVALAQQEQRMRELQEQMDRPVPTLVEEEIIPEEPIVIQPEPTPPPLPEPLPPQVIYQEPPMATVPPPPPTPASTPPPPAPEPPPTHSMQDWLALANMGSYGTGIINNEQSSQRSQPRQVVNNNQPTAQQVSQQNTQQLSLSSDEQRLMGNTRTIRAGTRIKGEIVNSMIAVDGESPLIAVVTSEPIEVNSRVVIPTGTEVIFESTVHSSGIVVANAISLFMNDREIELPPQVLQLRASQGQPLMAQKQNNHRGEILRRDAMGFALGALGKVGEISNRATTTSTFTGVSGTGSTSTFNEPNYAGAVLEGGFNPISRQWEQRNQQAINQLQGQGDIWMIPINQPVEIIISRSFSM